jgi:uncharacterized protein YjiS (DUF1127 family)
MSASITNRECAGAVRETGTRRALRAAVRILAWPAQAWRVRQEYALLAGMSEHELRDIGLSRQDVVDVSAYKVGEDPTLMLAKRAEERRRWSRRR